MYVGLRKIKQISKIKHILREDTQKKISVFRGRRTERGGVKSREKLRKTTFFIKEKKLTEIKD